MIQCADCNKRRGARLLTASVRAAARDCQKVNSTLIASPPALVDGAARLAWNADGPQFRQFCALRSYRRPHWIALAGNHVVGIPRRIEKRPIPVRVLPFGNDPPPRNPRLLQCTGM